MHHAEFYANNRKKLLLEANSDVIVIPAAGLLQRNSDAAFPFRQESNFMYLTGCNQADILLIITKDKHFIILPKRDKHRDVWEGTLSSEDITKISGVDELLSYKDGWNLINSFNTTAKIGVVKPSKSYISSYGMYTNPAQKVLLTKLQSKKFKNFIDIRLTIARLRSIKTEYEISLVQKAISITADSLESLKNLRYDFKYEYDYEHRLTYEFSARGADGHAFSPIIATDKNATIIHSIKNADSVKNAQMILFDIGAEFQSYAADISRIYALQKPSQRLMQVYTAVADVQKQIVSFVKPGLTLKQVEHKTELLLQKKLTELKLNKPLRYYYPHGVSHHLGLDVHDAADYSMPLQKNMIITVEPGLYIPDENIGIRIEDDVLITDTGSKNLSAKIPNNLLYWL